MSKPKLVTVRGLHNLTQQLADLLVERLGIDAIRASNNRDQLHGIYDLIRPELPSGVTNAEVRDVAIIMTEEARTPPLPNTFSAATYDLYLRED